MSFEILPLTSPKSKSGYAFSLRIDGEPYLLLDAGAGSMGETDWLDATPPHPHIWLSHGHADHVGALPKIFERWSNFDVFMPQVAFATAKGVLASIGFPKDRIEAIFSQIVAVKSFLPFQIGELRSVCGPSGHGIGAHLLRIELARESALKSMPYRSSSNSGIERTSTFTIAYTGDWALHERYGTPTAATDLIEDADVLIAEASFAGARFLEHFDHSNEVENLQKFLNFGAPRLVVVAPFSELDEVKNIVRDLADQPLFANGIGEIVGVEDHPISHCANALNENAVVVACGSSMDLSTPAGVLAANLVENPNAKIALINRVPPNTPAEKFLRTPRRSKSLFYGKNRRLRAHVRHFLLPDHALPYDLEAFFSREKFKKILLFHCKNEALYALKRRVDGSRFKGKIVIGEEINSLDKCWE